MKRIRIWLSNFTLIQQFLSIAFITFAVFIFFIFTFLNSNIDSFVNTQMYTYIHRSQDEYLETRKTLNESNVIHIIYNTVSKRFLNTIPQEYVEMMETIDKSVTEQRIDSSYVIDNNSIVYSIIGFDNDYLLISIAKNNFREEFRNALFNGVINTTFYVVSGLIAFILIWVISLIRPLDQIKSYINKIKIGEKATLSVNRYDEIGEVAEALTNMNDELEQQQRIRDEMVQNISHDLKTPVSTIKSYSESIKDGIYPYDTLEKSVDVIIDNADRLEKKVYSLITYNKMGYLQDNGDRLLNLKMEPVIQKVILSAQVLRNDIKIETDMDPSVYFHGEEEPWRVVVENLLDNSIRYAKSLITITLKDNLLEVYNDGPSIEKDRLDKLFKPYEKGNKGKFGLGLSIVKKVTETYGYTVTGENMSDGVVFRIYTNVKMKKMPKKRNSKKSIIET